MSTLCIIPARGGSKRLPGKNIKMLDGKPLLIHTVDVALSCFDRVVVSSDNQEILDVVSRLRGLNNKLSLDKRLDYLATDTSKAIDVVRSYFNKMDNFVVEHRFSPPYDFIALMLPTCPLRTAKHVREAMSYFEFPGPGLPHAASVVSITDYEFPIMLGLELNNGFITERDKSCPFANDNTRSQDHNPVYRPNGALYISRWEAFRTHQNFFKGTIRGYYMDRASSVDIDTELDFVVAEAVMKWKREKQNG